MQMNDLVKTVLASSVVAGLVSLLTTSCMVDKQLRVKQAEAGYEALVQSDAEGWHARDLLKEGTEKGDETLTAEAHKLRREADALMLTARIKIATFGDDAIAQSMSHYFAEHQGYSQPCDNQKKARDDAKIYSAIRSKIGAGGNLREEDIAVLVFGCRVE